MKLNKNTHYFLFLSFFYLLFFSVNVSAQKGVAMDRIVLSDGSELYGHIISKELELTLELEDGQEIIIALDEIESIENKNPNKLYFRNGAFIHTKGWYHKGSISFGGGGGNRNGGNSTAIEIINGFQISESFGIGLGVGLHLHTYHNEGYGEQAFFFSNDQYSLLPIFAEAKITPWSRRIAPFFTANVGYGIGADLFNYWGDSAGKVEGGLLAGATAGLQIATRRKMGFLFHIKYQMQEAYSERDDPSGFFRITDITFHRILLGIGWSF